MLYSEIITKSTSLESLVDDDPVEEVLKNEYEPGGKTFVSSSYIPCLKGEVVIARSLITFDTKHGIVLVAENPEKSLNGYWRLEMPEVRGEQRLIVGGQLPKEILVVRSLEELAPVFYEKSDDVYARFFGIVENK